MLPLAGLTQDITGIWTGYLKTSGSQLSYELAISENVKKLSGYSMIVFTNDGVENIGIKTAKLKQGKKEISFEDDELVYNNFTSPSTRSKLLGLLWLEVKDSLMILRGTFRTRSLDFRDTRTYSGEIYLQKENKQASSKMLPKLEELNLLQTLSFFNPLPKKKINIPGPIVDSEVVKKATITEPINATPQVAIKKIPNEPINTTPQVAVKKIPNEPINTTPQVAIKKISNESINATPQVAIKKISNEPINAQTHIVARKTEKIQDIFFNSDSLVLSLFDNGTIDGDTVSLLLNGRIIADNIGLSSRAYKITIPMDVKPGDSLQLVMYAENLGSIPPNTGLLIIEEGNNRYEIRFAGDLQKSSAIMLRKKIQ